MAKNKLVRSDNYNAHKSRATREKSALRKERAKQEEQDPTLRVKRQRENIPVTIDQKRYYDPSRITDAKSQVTQSEVSATAINVKREPTSDSSSSDEDEEDENDGLKNGKETPMMDATDDTKPETSKKSTIDGKVTLITTSPNPTKLSYHFLTTLASIFPHSDTIRRGSAKYSIPDIARYAYSRGYRNLIVINEDRKSINAIQFIALPSGPTTYFTISNLVVKQLASHTTHIPELILNNFTTTLGISLQRTFRDLFPDAQVSGRQVVSLHNSRDFIFFRRYRYVFTGAGEKVKLQEIGPRFTLKCREVVDGVARSGEVIWRSDAGLESDRKRMFL